MSKFMNGSINYLYAEEENYAICPLLTIAMQSEVPCKGRLCAFFVQHWDGENFDELGHCGFVHPEHHGLDMYKDEKKNG